MLAIDIRKRIYENKHKFIKMWLLKSVMSIGHIFNKLKIIKLQALQAESC